MFRFLYKFGKAVVFFEYRRANVAELIQHLSISGRSVLAPLTLSENKLLRHQRVGLSVKILVCG